MAVDDPAANRRRARTRSVLLAVLVLAAATTLVTEWLLPREDAWKSPQAVVVLSSGVLKDGQLDRTGTQRLRRAIGVSESTGLRLMTTRVQRKKPPHLSSDSIQKSLVNAAHLTSGWQTTSDYVISTRSEAEQVRRDLGVARIALVTSRLHTRRACMTFEKVGFEVTCLSSGIDGPIWEAPYFVLYELTAHAWYRVKGWL